MTDTASGYVPPPYPYERIDRFKPLGDAFPGGLVDLSIGTPFDPPPAAVIAALGGSGAERSYPPSIGTPALREAAARWIDRRFGLDVPADHLAACIGTKEFVASLPLWLRLRRPDRDTVLYPSIAYPTYEMGAVFAGCRAVAVPMDPTAGVRLDAIDPADAARALVLWVNSPANPSGVLDDLGAAAAWGRHHEVPVFSDECYTEFTWNGPQRTILESGVDGVVAVHSLSKRSNLAGVRVGFYAGDPELVHYLREVRKHAGLMVPGPAQAAAAAALDDDEHVRGAARCGTAAASSCSQRSLGTWDGRTMSSLPDPAAFYLWIRCRRRVGLRRAPRPRRRCAGEPGGVLRAGEGAGVRQSGRGTTGRTRCELVADRLALGDDPMIRDRSPNRTPTERAMGTRSSAAESPALPSPAGCRRPRRPARRSRSCCGLSADRRH